MIVADASVLIDYLLGMELPQDVVALLEDPGTARSAPEVMDLEVMSGLRQLMLAGRLAPARAAEAVLTCAELRIRRHSHGSLLDRIWELRHNLTPYDAAYLALAEALDGELITRDAAFRRIRLKSGRVRVV
ncbi:MAG: type II toxin-antitoxin system VapC family toxin [Acidobacteria bacterium]|nr:type II toxin-antitoxin system VapC family toxin [Acidobacteriota bacterium]